MDKADYPRCATCKWWVHDPAYPPYQSEAANVNPGLDWGQCMKTLQNDPDSDAALTSKALSIATDEACSDALWTAPDFGCCQHEPKEDADGRIR